MVSRGDNSIILLPRRQRYESAAKRSAGAGREGAEMSEVVQVERNGGVATIRMNRPERMNAYNPEMGKALLSAVADASVDPSVRCIVLTGNGKGFSAGGGV